MDFLTHSEDRRLLIRMAFLSLAALLLAAALGLAMTAYVNHALADTYAGIVGTVAQKYPQAEAQVVRDLSAPDARSVDLGQEVLARYGLEDLGAAQSGIGVGVLARLLPAGLALTGLCCAGFALLLTGYRRSISAQVAGLSAYLRQIEAGDYALDVRDNGEGGFSLLKNDVYKVTVRLREQAELLQKDKTALSNLIADISHQIKTPLTSLGVLADLLAEDPPEEDRRAFVERLHTQLGRIQWLVAALLKLARLDVGTAAFKSEPVDVRPDLAGLADAALDPVASTGVFGSQPLSAAYGAHHFGVDGAVDPVTGAALSGSVGHVDYFTAGSESFRNMALIGIGQGRLVLDADGHTSAAPRALG